MPLFDSFSGLELLLLLLLEPIRLRPLLHASVRAPCVIVAPRAPSRSRSWSWSLTAPLLTEQLCLLCGNPLRKPSCSQCLRRFGAR